MALQHCLATEVQLKEGVLSTALSEASSCVFGEANLSTDLLKGELLRKALQHINDFSLCNYKTSETRQAQLILAHLYSF